MREVTKRIFDVVLASLGLIVLAPVFGLIAAAIRWKMGPPVLFRHARVGKDERRFVLYKFRTMTDARDPAGRLLPDPERLTGLGRLLRATSLDELPQLWNVLRGEMSLVGPRPLIAAYLPRYNRRQRRRHEVKPGITGWAQIHGRNGIRWEQKFELDVWYVDHWSFWLDLKILCLTFARVIARQGINESDRVISSEFLGSPDGESPSERRLREPELGSSSRIADCCTQTP